MLSSLLTLALSSCLLLAASVSAETLKFVPNAYIVEFDTEKASVPEPKMQIKLASFLSNLHADFDTHLRKRGVSFTMRQEFHEPSIFSGVSIRLADPSLVGELHTAPNVKSVYRTRSLSNPNEGLKVKVVSGAKAKAAQADTFAPHVMTGVNRLHAQGYYGKGVRVAILDTGVDYKHPALGGCFGKGCLVEFGYDLVGQDYNGKNTPKPDPIPYSNCGTHGTHVSGTVAANDTTLGFTGVAPQATLGMYRVFGCVGDTGDDVLMAGILRAYKDKADVISMSLGEGSGWTESPLSVLSSRIAQKGVVVVASQGNEAISGMFFSSAPATGLGVISVASVDNTKFSTYTAKTSINRDVQYLAAISFNQAAQPIRYYGEGCATYPDGTDLRNQVVLLRRGSCALTQKAINAGNFGAKTVLIFNTPGLAPVVPESSEYGVKSGAISQADGEALLAAINASTPANPVTISFPQQRAVEIANTDSGGKVSSFSTYGPTYNLDQANPAIAAPGGNILSTWPVRYGSYAIISGTSMAAPFIAGSAALYLSAKGKTKANALAFPTVISTTAVPIANYSQGSTILNTVVQQGGGLLNLSHAITASSFVSPQMLFLNDTASLQRSQKIKVKNNGKKAVTYQLGHTAAGTALALDKQAKTYFRWPVPLVSNAASVRFTSSKFVVQPGRTVTITATFTPPKGLDPKQQPVYSGFVTIKSSAEKEPYQIPYFGLAANIRDQTILYRYPDLFNHTLPVLTDSNGEFQDRAKTYSFKTNDRPSVNFYLQSGTAYVAIDVVKSNAQGLPSNPGPARARALTVEEDEEEAALERRAGFGAVPTMEDGLMPRQVVELAVKVPTDMLSAAETQKPFNTLGQISGGSGTYLPRNDGDAYSFEWDGTIDTGANSTRTVPNGSYRLFLTALKITGNPSRAADYETWLSPIVTVKKS